MLIFAILVVVGIVYIVISPSSGIALTRDPDLEPGFPVRAPSLQGTYGSGARVATLVGNIDDDPQLEIIASSIAIGPLYAWKWDGTPAAGWPVGYGFQYAGLGKLSATLPGYQVFAGSFLGPDMTAYSGSGDPLPGWPFVGPTYTSGPPTLVDIDADGLDEIFAQQQYGSLYAFEADGTLFPGWPVGPPFLSTPFQTPAIADIDGNGLLEIVTASEGFGGQQYLYAYRIDASVVPGFPIAVPDQRIRAWPAIGDVDGDGSVEIVLVSQSYVQEYTGGGTLKRNIPLIGTALYAVAPTLADLNGDGIPEIIVQTGTHLDAWKGDGSVLPGWPVVLGNEVAYWVCNSAPVVGDVDGDQQPDIVITLTSVGTDERSYVRVYNRLGVLHPRFPKDPKIGEGAVPAIADIDLDGRNEIVVSGNYWIGYEGYFDKVWVYDLGGPPHGRIEWGQFMGGPKHLGYYESWTLLPHDHWFVPFIAK